MLRVSARSMQNARLSAWIDEKMHIIRHNMANITRLEILYRGDCRLFRRVVPPHTLACTPCPSISNPARALDPQSIHF